MSYAQEPLDASYDPGSFIGQLGTTEEPCVDPQLTLHQELSGGAGFSEYHGNSGLVQRAYDASAYPQNYGIAHNYINTPDPDMSSDGFGQST